MRGGEGLNEGRCEGGGLDEETQAAQTAGGEVAIVGARHGGGRVVREALCGVHADERGHREGHLELGHRLLGRVVGNAAQSAGADGRGQAEELAGDVAGKGGVANGEVVHLHAGAAGIKEVGGQDSDGGGAQVGRWTKEDGQAEDEGVGGLFDGGLGGGLLATVGVDGVAAGILGVGGVGPVEDVVGGDMDEGAAALGEAAGEVDIEGEDLGGVAFAEIRPTLGRAVENEVGGSGGEEGGDGIGAGEVDLAVGWGGEFPPGGAEGRCDLSPEEAGGTKEQEFNQSSKRVGPKRRRAFSVVRRARCSGATPRTWARHSAVARTRTGRLRSPRKGTGAR